MGRQDSPGSDDDATALIKTVSATKRATLTPVFAATNAARYQRRALILNIEELTGHQLICVVGGSATAVRRDDVLFLNDLLHNINRDKPIDLLLHTPGGDMDAAEKLVMMLHAAAGSASLRIVVPDFAKSAGTLMALGADCILMSDTSELGPIDPQIVSEDRNGIILVTAIQNYLDAFDECSLAVNASPNDAASRQMLDKFEPARVHQYRAAMIRAKKLAEGLLNLRMSTHGNVNWTSIASMLLDTKQYQSHSQMIGHVEAKALGLRVEYMLPDDEIWQSFWQLYCYQRMEVDEKFKLFETKHASLKEHDPV